MNKILCITDAAYLAGLVDGEGSICVSRTHTGQSAKSCKRGFAYRSSVGTPEGRVFSLRSIEDGPDVSAIASNYGGGGHAHASGFRMSIGWEGDAP